MALTHEQAVAAARAYLEAHPFAHSAYRHVPTSGTPVPGGWYFNFDFERVDGLPLGDRDEFGGAPGYIVSAADGTVRVVGWAEYQERQFGAG
jgi:hypothetical protein